MSEMTRADREQQAREWLDHDEGIDAYNSLAIPSLVKLLADTERATLEEVAGETRRFTSAGAVAQWCRQQAKERS